MKKILASLLAGALLVSMTACGGSSTTPASSTSPAPDAAPSDAAAPAPDAAPSDAAAPAENTGDKPYIAVVSKGFQHQFWQVVNKGAQAAADELGVEISFDGPPTESDIAIQVDMLKSALDKKPAAVCLAALDPDSVKEQLDACKAANIPVIGFDSGVPGVEIYATAATDNNAAAAIAADELFKNADFKAKFDAATPEAPIKVGVLSQDATSASIIGRTEGFINKLVELAGDENVSVSGHDKYKKDGASAKLQIVVNVPATTAAADQKTGAEALLGETLTAIYGSNENAAGGILAATNDGSDFAKDTGKYKDTIAVGFDAGKTQRTAVENGWFYGAVTQDPYSIGYQAVKLAVEAINGGTADNRIVDTGAKWYNAENLTDPAISELVYE